MGRVAAVVAAAVFGDTGDEASGEKGKGKKKKKKEKTNKAVLRQRLLRAEIGCLCKATVKIDSIGKN